MEGAVEVRPFRAGDIPGLWRLMAALAAFEGYDDEFAVSETDLAAHGLGDAPMFQAFVADGGADGVLGNGGLLRYPLDL